MLEYGCSIKEMYVLCHGLHVRKLPYSTKTNHVVVRDQVLDVGFVALSQPQVFIFLDFNEW